MKEMVIKYLTLLHQFDIINSQLLFIVKKGGVFCEKNISTEQKKTPNNGRLQSPHENSRRT